MSLFEYIMGLKEEDLDISNKDLESKLNYEQKERVNQKIKEDEHEDRLNELSESGVMPMSAPQKNMRRKQYFNYYAREELEKLNVPPTHGGNKKNKPKIYKNKIIQGKERNIYKIPGSRKDYIKYKGAFIAVNDYIKSKNK